MVIITKKASKKANGPAPLSGSRAMPRCSTCGAHLWTGVRRQVDLRREPLATAVVRRPGGVEPVDCGVGDVQSDRDINGRTSLHRVAVLRVELGLRGDEVARVDGQLPGLEVQVMSFRERGLFLRALLEEPVPKPAAWGQYVGHRTNLSSWGPSE